MPAPGTRRASLHSCPRPGPQPCLAGILQERSVLRQVPGTKGGWAAAASRRERSSRLLPGVASSGSWTPPPAHPKQAPPRNTVMESTKNQATQQQPQGFPYARKTYPHTLARTGEHTCYPSARGHSFLSPPQVWQFLTPAEGPRPAAGSEHSRPGCARPVAAVPDAGGGDQICGCSRGSSPSHGPSRRQSGWSREASAPILVRRPGKLPAAPPPPAARYRQAPGQLWESAPNGSAAHHAEIRGRRLADRALWPLTWLSSMSSFETAGRDQALLGPRCRGQEGSLPALVTSFLLPLPAPPNTPRHPSSLTPHPSPLTAHPRDFSFSTWSLKPKEDCYQQRYKTNKSYIHCNGYCYLPFVPY